MNYLVLHWLMFLKEKYRYHLLTIFKGLRMFVPFLFLATLRGIFYLHRTHIIVGIFLVCPLVYIYFREHHAGGTHGSI